MVSIQQLQAEAILYDFRFLSDNVIVVAINMSLGVFTIPEQHSSTGQMSMTKVAMLSLPFDDYMGGRTFCNPPNKHGTPRNAAVPTKPFTNSSDNIIYCYVSAFDGRAYDGCPFIVHSLALLRYAMPLAFKHIPWKEWGMLTRFVEADHLNQNRFSGQRCLLTFAQHDEILDFDQYRVNRLGRDFKVETEMAHISVVTEESQMTTAFRNKLYSSLPYVRIVLKQSGPPCLSCLDDDRIFAVGTYCFPLSFLMLMLI